MDKQNKFKIIIPSYNNEEWVEYNIASILNQTYINYEVLYIDDFSTDKTYKNAFKLLNHLPNWTVKKQPSNIGATANYFDYLNTFVEDSDILIHLDGDDWFYDENVLENLNNFYNKNDYWMTYGGFVVWNGENTPPTLPYPQSTPYPDSIHDNKLYRRDLWRASHLRTYRGFLIKSIKIQDLKSLIDQKYYWHASDLAFQFPCMEMCPKDKIGLVDFYTCIYNQSKQNLIRTQERESSNNQIYEIEIRNRKTYKEGINQGKLPQVNVYGDYLERHTHPSLFSYCYNVIHGEYDILYVQDEKIIDFIYGDMQIPEGVKVVARVCENRKFFNQQLVIDALLISPERFDLILTWDKELLKLSNAVFCPLTEITQFNVLPNTLPQDAFQIYNKNKLISAISSNKSTLPGHVARLQLINAIKGKVDLYGRGINEIPSKLDGLKDYMFSVAIENATDTNYFTEKLTDCLLTGTIPIYYGCTNVGDFFDINGIIAFKNLEDLTQILNNLTPELYQSKMESIKNNFKLALTYPTDNDSMFNLYYKNLINE